MSSQSLLPNRAQHEIDYNTGILAKARRRKEVVSPKSKMIPEIRPP